MKNVPLLLCISRCVQILHTQTDALLLRYKSARRVWAVLTALAVAVLVCESCKSLLPETLHPAAKNDRLLPALTAEFDWESFFARFPAVITSESGDAESGFVTTTRNNPHLTDFNLIFQRDVENNICVLDWYGEKHGYVVCGMVDSDSRYGYAWLVPSTLTFFTVNLLGMPLLAMEDGLQLEVNVFTRDNRLVGRYRSGVHRSKSYLAMYWGYRNPTGRNNRLIFTQCMEDIKRQIAADYDRLTEALK